MKYLYNIYVSVTFIFFGTSCFKQPSELENLNFLPAVFQDKEIIHSEYYSDIDLYFVAVEKIDLQIVSKVLLNSG